MQHDPVIPISIPVGTSWIFRPLGKILNEGAFDNNTYPGGSRVTTHDFEDVTISVGHIYFHPGTRNATPPTSELQTWITANPNAPVVIDPKTGLEISH